MGQEHPSEAARDVTGRPFERREDDTIGGRLRDVRRQRFVGRHGELELFRSLLETPGRESFGAVRLRARGDR